MPMIEGVGDEVVQFVGVVLVIVVAALAWWSTNARPDRYRTVLVMRTRAHHPVSVRIRARPSFAVTSIQGNNSSQPTSDIVLADTPETVEEPRENSQVIPLQEMDSIVDADMAMLDSNRLHFYRRIDSPNTSLNVEDMTSDEHELQEADEPPSNPQIREMDNIVRAMEADVVVRACGCYPLGPNSPLPTLPVNDSDASDENNSAAAGGEGPSGNNIENKILIRLKYLNDTLKEVEGNLDELLKDFKSRHFSAELSSESRVRLIFNGRVLEEAATLRALGLYHRAVVHALVHPKRQAVQAAGGEEAPLNATHELVAEGAGGAGAGGGAGGADRTWDLENILMTLVSVALTIVWFFRCEYSNMFTASASVALFGLTVFYSVAIFGLYLSDTFHIDRRPHPQPVPAN